MPDISLIVPLANLFGVPTDVLFGVYGTDHKGEIKERLAEIFRMCDNCPDGEEAPTALIILDKYRETMRLYPNDPTVLISAMAFAEMVLSANRSELKDIIGQEGLDGIAQEIRRWANLVIKYSTSVSDILSAKKRLINLYVSENNMKEAYEIAKTFPDELSATRGILMADLNYSAGETEEQRRQHCRNIRELAEKLGHQAIMLGNLYMNVKQYKNALYCYSFVSDMIDSMYREEAYRPPFIFYSYPLYRFPAYCLMKLGREDDAVSLLEKGVNFLLAQAKDFNKKRSWIFRF